MFHKLAIVVLVPLATPAWGEGALRERFTDPDDGRFDASNYLLDHRGVLPVPIIITEPAVGYGGGLAAAWFSESIRDAAAHARPGGRVTPPNIYAAAAFATENGTKGGAVGARISFDDDRWRYRGLVGALTVNLDFYGVGADLPKIGYTLKGGATFQEVTRRIGDSDHFLGARLLYLDLKSNLQAGDTGLQPREFAHKSSELGVTWAYDSRDNIFFTQRGVSASLDAMLAAPGIGSDGTFQTYRAHAFGYIPADEKVVVALRADGRTARGDVPFYQFPFIDMRGVPAARYQGEHTGVLEAEARYYVTPRWVAVAFLGLAAGIDVARGPEKTAFYIQVGNAWR